MRSNDDPGKTGAGLLAALLLASFVAGCAPRADCAQTAEKLGQANQRIAALEGELASLRPGAPGESARLPEAAAPVAPPATPPATAAPPAPPAAAPVGKQWEYRASEEQMTNGTRKSASVESTNTVEFGFPYNGAQHGHLTLRTDPRYGRDVIFRIEKGQILCTSYEGCTVQVRFDDDKPSNFSASTAADHSSELVFLNDYARFLARMKKAKRVRLSLDIYQSGRPVFDFDVSGFDVVRYQAKS